MLTTTILIIYAILFIAYSTMGIAYTIEEMKTFNPSTPIHDKIAMIILLLIIWPMMKYIDNL